MDLNASFFVCNHSVNKGSYEEMKAHKRTLCQVCGSAAKGSLILFFTFYIENFRRLLHSNLMQIMHGLL